MHANPSTADVSRQFTAAARHPRDGLSKESAELLDRVVDTVQGELNWDPGEEDWAMILTPARDDVLAHVYMKAPLVIVRTDVADAVRAVVDAEVELIIVNDADDELLVASSESVSAAFGDAVLRSEFDPSSFTPRDLWFHTI